ncbi:MAG TPA: serine/threonine-protein kinase, partial [Myxococcales bacterium]|nr:serine/threonine-protein kinase [Myxococcales bacterium]
MKATAAAPTIPERTPVGLQHPSDTLDLTGRSRALRAPLAAPAASTAETEVRTTPVEGTRLDDGSGDDPLIGQTPLGQYTILKRIGEGGFGSVYLADQIGVARKAVIKVLRRNLVGSQRFVKRFQREAAVLGALDHHHLIRLFNFGELPGGQLFLAMEYGGDRTLADEIKQHGRLGFERALRITEQVCLALHEAHVHGVVHRDLKPANIMLGQKEGVDWVKVVDVGIAKILDTADVDDGQSGLTDA